MNISRPVLAALGAWILAGGEGLAQAAAPDPALPVRQLTTSVIVPRFEAVAAAARAQQAAWTAFCADRAKADPKTLTEAYGALGDAWARIEFVRMGPAAAELRAERFNYWLDRENGSGKALAAMLASADPLDLAGIKAGSVAGQGMPILERLIYGPDALDRLRAPGADGDRRCAVGLAVSASLSSLAQQMFAGWTGPDGAAAAIAADKPWGSSFNGVGEASRVLLTDLVGGIENLKDSKVPMAFHDAANPAAPILAEGARSGRTMRDVMLNFEAVRQALDVYMAPATPEQRKPLDEALDLAKARLDAVLEAEKATPPHSPGRVQALQAAIASLTDLQQTAMVVAPAGSGVALGFNSLDGD